MAPVDLMQAPPAPATSAPPPVTGPSRRRLLFAAVTGSGMLTGIYWTFPPIFADVESNTVRVVQPAALVRTASLSETATPVRRELPDIPLTPAIEAHRQSIALIEKGLARLKAIDGYTAEFAKQEVVGGEMTDPQRMLLKVRQEPFSVYMKWVEGKPGQELLYVKGENDGDMIVHPGGWRGRVLGTLSVDPDGTMARRESRHPVTQVGLRRLAEKVLTYRYNEVGLTEGYDCRCEQDEFGGRPCFRFTIVYDSPAVRAEYRKSVIWVDRDWSIVTQVANYAWPADDVPADRLDEDTLVERYSYTNINLDTQLAAMDFDAANGKYALRRR